MYDGLSIKPRRVKVLGVPVDCVNMDAALQWAETILKGERAHSVIAVNPEKVMKARQDPALLRRLEDTSLLIPDGIGVVFGMRLLSLGKAERVPGAELMPKLCELASQKGYKIFLFGASPEVNERAACTLKKRYPGLDIAGTRHGYVREEGMPELIAEINRSRPDLLFIALGSPKQELWMAQYLPGLKVKVCQGVGGTFDVLAGHVKRAPLVFRAMHLEWFYRLMAQPSRILRQTALPLFAFHVLRKRVFG